MIVEKTALATESGCTLLRAVGFGSELFGSFVLTSVNVTSPLATKHLIERGCRNIVHISGDLSVESGRERLQGYRNAHKKAGLKVKESNTIEGDHSEETAKRILEKFL